MVGFGEMLRPTLLVHAAEAAARSYRRRRDLPGAVAELLSRPEGQILPTLAREEARLEAERRASAPGYRIGRHLQVLAAYLAECRDAGVTPAAAAPALDEVQPKASGSDSLRRSMNSRRPSSTPASSSGC